MIFSNFQSGGRSGTVIPSFLSCASNPQRSNGAKASSSSSSSSRPTLHAWDVVVRFYRLKRGHEFNAAPQRKLSQSFGLDLAGSVNSNRQSLLATVGQILHSHGQYKRSPDAHFKAFICAGLK